MTELALSNLGISTDNNIHNNKEKRFSDSIHANSSFPTTNPIGPLQSSQLRALGRAPACSTAVDRAEEPLTNFLKTQEILDAIACRKLRLPHWLGDLDPELWQSSPLRTS